MTSPDASHDGGPILDGSVRLHAADGGTDVDVDTGGSAGETEEGVVVARWIMLLPQWLQLTR